MRLCAWGALPHPIGPDQRNASEAPAALEKGSTQMDEGLWRLSPKPTLAFGLPLSCVTHPNLWAVVTAGQRRPRQDGRKAPDGFISQNDHDDNGSIQHPLLREQQHV